MGGDSAAPSGAASLILASLDAVDTLRIEDLETRLAVDHVFNLVRNHLVEAEPPSRVDDAYTAMAQRMEDQVRRQVEHNAKMAEEYQRQIMQAANDFMEYRAKSIELVERAAALKSGK